MTLFSAPQLYDRLPAIMRLRDGESDGALRQLIQILGLQSAILEEDIRRLYDDQFIETCAPWLTAYIGDLIGFRPIHGVTARIANPRALVAGEIARRKRKGTVTALEALARDVTGWPAHAVEYFQRLIWTQNMNHVRARSTGTPSPGRPDPLRPLDGAFDASARTLALGRIQPGEGRHNVRNIGIHLWRLAALPVRDAPAFRLDGHRWFFSPLGADQPLFSAGRTEPDITHLAGPLDMPDRIGILALRDHRAAYYPRDLRVVVDGVPVPEDQVRASYLADEGGTWAHDPPSGVDIDPERGRIAFPSTAPAPTSVTVSYHYGTPFPIGGGSYDRAADMDAGLQPLVPARHGDDLQPLIDGVAGGGVVEIADSGIFPLTPALDPAADARLGLRAANEQRPTILMAGDLAIAGGDGAEVVLDGLLIAGGALRVSAASGIRRLILSHVTLVPGLSLNHDGSPASPGAPSLIVEAPNVAVEIRASILGPIRCVPDSEVSLQDSIVDAGTPTGVAFAAPDDEAAGGPLQAVDCTLIGKIHAQSMPLVSNCILDARLAPADGWSASVRAVRRQIGCIRFSVTPPDARTPRRHRCLPELAPAAQRAWAQPLFTDRRYGRPAYLQLSRGGFPGIATGADDEGEMGAYHKLFAPQRLANLRLRMDEYLPVGLEAGIMFQT
ncbi:hypothetical protein [Paracoccus siganidrum]|uniref:Phage tail protein n=1 Tax=Paracoccus siganidrum TaxID=1276757 RepID=A0A419A4M5_9RHOB|nr:hypothetical protein [Paracoccus siganidrum]RJL09746.1 hypothetical protein D3P05_14685 [Paracoccus siganidrum]RMC31907.1 hypothetical protein C9E82_15265 [Paracoccus siganidrum]